MRALFTGLPSRSRTRSVGTPALPRVPRRSPGFLVLLLPLILAAPPARAASYLEVPVIPASFGVTSSGFTVECWVKALGGPGFDPRIIRCRNAHEGGCGDAETAVWELWVCAHSACIAGNAFFDLQTGGVCKELQSNVGMADSTYHHIAATYDGTSERLYVDGVPAGSLALSSFFVDVTGGKLVVGNSTDYANGIDCVIDDIRLWSVARTQSEIQADMTGENASGPALVANWKLNGDGADAVGGSSLNAVGNVTFVPGKYGSAAYIVNTPPIPNTPTVTATDGGDANITVSWNDVPDENGYRVYRNGSWLAQNAANDTTFVDTPVPGTYTYCVEAFNTTGTSAQGCDSGARLVPPPPAAPASCAATDDQTNVVVTWPDVSGEDGYRVYRDGVLAGTVAANALTFTDTPTPGFYTYCVEAFNYGGASGRPCDEGIALPFAGHTYQVVYDPIATWHGADQAAGTSGKYLATIITAGEEAFIEALIARASPPLPGAFWIGFSKNSGAYTWGTGEISPFTHWAPNQPDNSRGQEAYASILFSPNPERNGFWNDAPDEGYGPGTDDIGRLGYIVETGPFTSTPSTPIYVNASDNSTSNVTLSWPDVAGESGYNVYREGSLIGTTGANATAYIDYPAPGKYSYCVEAYNSVGASGRSCDSGTRVMATSAPIAGPLATALTLAALGLAGSRAMTRRAGKTKAPEPRSTEVRR